MKHLELHNRPLDQKLIGFDEERKNSYEKDDVDRRELIRELHSEIRHLEASIVKPDPTRDSVFQDLKFGMNRQEAKIESQKIKIQQLQRDLASTQDPLNKWDEVNVSSILGVYVDDSIGTSISSVSRITEPAVSHVPQAGGDPGLFQTKRTFNAEGSTQIGCSFEYATSEQMESSTGGTQCIYFVRLVYRLIQQSQSLIMEDPKKLKPNTLSLTEDVKIGVKKRRVSFFAVSQSRYAMDK